MKLISILLLLLLPIIALAEKQNFNIELEFKHNNGPIEKYSIIATEGQKAVIGNELRGIQQTRITATPVLDAQGNITLEMDVYKSFKGIPVITAKPMIKTKIGQFASIEQMNEDTGEGYTLKVITNRTK